MIRPDIVSLFLQQTLACDAAIAAGGIRKTSRLYSDVLNVAWRETIKTLKTPETIMTTHGHFHWNELMTADAERAIRFYQQAIGWSFVPMPMEDGATYWVAYFDEQPVAGIFPTNRPAFESTPEGWMPYLAVDDVDRRTEKAVAAGAQLMRPIFDIPEIGRIAILTEPGGAGIGWITPVS